MSRKRDNFCREKRAAHRKQAGISWWDTHVTAFDHWVGIFGIACLKVSVSLYKKSCAGYKNKAFVENACATVDKEMGFEEGKEFFFSYVAWNSNEELTRYFRNILF